MVHPVARTAKPIMTTKTTAVPTMPKSSRSCPIKRAAIIAGTANRIRMIHSMERYCSLKITDTLQRRHAVAL